MEISRGLSGAGHRIQTLPTESSVIDMLVEEGHLPPQDPGKHESAQVEQAEDVLKDLIARGDQLAPFRLGQLFFEKKLYDSAFVEFNREKERDPQCKYQLAVMYYDGVGVKRNQQTAMRLMHEVACDGDSEKAAHLRHAACFNIGSAFLHGVGVPQSYSDAEKWLLLAADDGNPRGSILAQSTLGLFYCQADFQDYKKAFFWHSEACGNGSLESQGCLGWFYYLGRGVKKDVDAAYECWKEAAERGNVHAMGCLVMLYYQRKLYNKAAQLAHSLTILEDLEEIAEQTECLVPLMTLAVARAAFLYARCLERGLGVQQDKAKAREYYSMAVWYGPELAQQLQKEVQQGRI